MFVMTISTSYKMEADMRVWRNRQTRTFKGRVRKSKGSSPFTRTSYRHQKPVFLCIFCEYADLLGLERDSEAEQVSSLAPQKKQNF